MRPILSSLVQSKRQITYSLIGLMALAIILIGALMLNQNFSTLSVSRATGSSQAPLISESKIVSKDVSFLSLIESSMHNMTARQLEDLYYFIIQHRQIECFKWRRIGKEVDGGWDVCFTAPFDIRRVSGRPCVAFSFGINGVFEYDDELADAYHCRVYMFDPSMTKVEDHQRKKTSWFYKLGLGPSNSVQKKTGWTMRTLCTLFKQFGFENSPIDILKVDIELWEWDSFDAALREGCLSRVRQLLFESHTDELVYKRPDYGKLVRVWLGLFKIGFRTWKFHENPYSIFFKSITGDQRACCYEHYLVNVAHI